MGREAAARGIAGYLHEKSRDVENWTSLFFLVIHCCTVFIAHSGSITTFKNTQHYMGVGLTMASQDFDIV